mmetsp:Transcript_2355/g.2659  ORF Transcript_2355/g.2659 Transcript_2355/m.2659 type:complete len:80 (+) Transcript_2355:223-462(+)
MTTKSHHHHLHHANCSIYYCATTGATMVQFFAMRHNTLLVSDIYGFSPLLSMTNTRVPPTSSSSSIHLYILSVCLTLSA